MCRKPRKARAKSRITSPALPPPPNPPPREPTACGAPRYRSAKWRASLEHSFRAVNRERFAQSRFQFCLPLTSDLEDPVYTISVRSAEFLLQTDQGQFRYQGLRELGVPCYSGGARVDLESGRCHPGRLIGSRCLRVVRRRNRDLTPF